MPNRRRIDCIAIPPEGKPPQVPIGMNTLLGYSQGLVTMRTLRRYACPPGKMLIVSRYDLELRGFFIVMEYRPPQKELA